MNHFKKSGFTLVELMIVIAIIGVLSAALIAGIHKLQHIARAARCKANLKTLFQAAQNFGTDTGRYPAAGSYEWTVRELTPQPRYHGEHAWVSWTLGGGTSWPWGSGNSSTERHGSKMSRSVYFGNAAFISITNGTLWELVGKDAGVYVCEAHRTEAKKVLNPQSEKVYRSYVMNHNFRWDNGNPQDPQHTDHVASKRWTHEVIMDGKAGIRCMFAELPANDIQKTSKYADSVLQNDEPIGFNHLLARKWVGHVVFVDGHVEGLIRPRNASLDVLRKLTGHLCDATEIDKDIRDQMR